MAIVGAGAGGRVAAELDRTIALTDRGASAKEREFSSVDELTGTSRRAAGFTELDREIGRARRTGEPLTVVSVDVDALETTNASRGRDAGDRLLIDVAGTITAMFPPYDPIIRSGEAEFVCAVSGLDEAGATKRLALFHTALAGAPEHGSVAAGVAEL